MFKPVITRNKKVEGRIDVELKLVQNMERRMMVEREVFINMLQGRDATQHRVSAKKLGRGNFEFSAFLRFKQVERGAMRCALRASRSIVMPIPLRSNKGRVSIVLFQ